MYIAKIRKLCERLEAMSQIVSQLNKEKEKSLLEIQTLGVKMRNSIHQVKVIKIIRTFINKASFLISIYSKYYTQVMLIELYVMHFLRLGVILPFLLRHFFSNILKKLILYSLRIQI